MATGPYRLNGSRRGQKRPNCARQPSPFIVARRRPPDQCVPRCGRACRRPRRLWPRPATTSRSRRQGLARTCAGPPDVDQHTCLVKCIILVIFVTVENFHLSAENFFGPMTLFTRLRSRPQVVDGCADRPRIFIECHRIKLIGTGQFRTSIPTRSGPDMTLNAGHPCMRSGLICHKFRFHHRMASLTAKGY